MGISEVDLKKALEIVPEEERQIVCGELLMMLLAALRQQFSEGDHILSEEVGRLLEQKIMTSVSDALVSCFELDTLLPGLSHVNPLDVRREALVLGQLIA
ncbi:MAG: hypothetical protein IPK84_03155 [Candidatus Moraniibacteriota bacterium]|nr:MAG: hypothetical protein IPK84_03155 [Candidatus Moranbacteria bacterium]